MAQIDLGKLKFTWKGTWSTASAYEVDDVVYYLGSAYICIADASNTTNSPEQNTTNWTRMSSGLNYRGTFTTPTGYTWYYGDIVTYQNTAYFHSLKYFSRIHTGKYSVSKPMESLSIRYRWCIYKCRGH